MGALIAALLPVALLIGLGFGLRRLRVVAEGFWPGAERLTYFVLVPALLLHGLATADLSGVAVGRFVGALVLPLLLVSGVLIAARPLFAGDGPAFTSLFQGGIRFNNLVGFGIAGGLYGPAGVAMAALATAAIVPTVNLLCILVFSHFGNAGAATLAGMARAVVLNPLILACAAGSLLQAAGLRIPLGLEPTVRALAGAATPIGLLCVGAALDPGALGRGRAAAGAACIAKFAGLPLATALCCAAFGVTGQAAGIALTFASLPTAPSAYILARQLGGDAPLMAGIIALQTGVAALAIPLVLALAGNALP